MKMTSTILLAAVMLLNIVAAPLKAQDNAQAPPEKSEEKATPARADSVRIDNTGVHVGGEDSVDINIPNLGGGMFGVQDPLSPMNGPFLLSIISVLVIFGMPVAIVALFVALRHRRNRLLHETLRAMVEKGVPIPPELLTGGGVARAGASNGAGYGNRDLRWGLVLIAVGVGVGVMAGKLGIIPFFIGVALLIVWLIGVIANKRKNTPAQ